MVSPTVLNHQTHRGLRVRTGRGAQYGENVQIVPVLADELQRVALEYPVFLTKDADTGRFGLCALLGFEAEENLFLDGGDWDANYIPVHIRRQPFMVGYAADTDSSGGDSPIITIDMDSKRVQTADGEALFDKNGNRTPFLTGIEGMLARLISAASLTELMLEKLADFDLIESAHLDVTLPGGEKTRLEGLYTVSDEKLAESQGDVLEFLHQRGFLRACHLMLASIGNVQELINRKSVQSTDKSADNSADQSLDNSMDSPVDRHGTRS